MYISIYNSCHSIPVAIFDLKKKRFISNHLGLGCGGSLSADLAQHGCHGYKSSMIDLNKLPRNTRGAIEASFIPTRIPLEELQVSLLAAMSRGGQQQGDRVKPLRGGLTPENRFQRIKVITDQLVKCATDLRAEGHTWRVIAASLGVGIAALKTAHQRLAPV